jgi:GT2 family glycosyltransferase/glycosyltransferase involved in cell wall biosynthesis
MDDNVKKFTIVSAIHNKEESLVDYFRFIRKQRFDGHIEVVLVDDCSTDNSLNVMRWAKANFSSEKLSVVILCNDLNFGNCVSRNRGLLAASGDYICVIDADCCLSQDFVAEHVRGHETERGDVCIGPMGIDSRGRDIEALINDVLQDPKRLHSESRLQYPIEPTAFVNTVTRNFSISAKFLERMAEPLFDEQFGYNLNPKSGFGWEDVEMGYRLYKLGASIAFRPNAISVHKTHEPEVSDEIKAVRSARNFIKLSDKHPDLPVIAIEWFYDTHQKICNWLDRTEQPAESERARLAEMAKQTLRRVAPRRHAKSRRRILTMKWHVGHQFDLWKLPYQFDMVTGLTKFGSEWDYSARPLPPNARFVDFDKIDFEQYDLAILHFDEWSLRPELFPQHAFDWGATFKYLLDFPGPKIAICHGTPLTERDIVRAQKDRNIIKRPAMTELTGRQTKQVDPDIYRSELVRSLDGTLVITNSFQAAREWQFVQSSTVWHGFDPLHYPPCDSTGQVISVSAMRDRPDYRGLRFYESVRALTRAQIHHLGSGVPNNIQKPKILETYADANLLGLANYRNYIQVARQYGVFFNSTQRSPMPRVRGEAMMLGQAVVTRSEHDSELFIDNGYNGFISDDAAETAQLLDELCQNQVLRKIVGRRARETALDLFHANNYVEEWRALIENYLKSPNRSSNSDPAGTNEDHQTPALATQQG